MYNRLLNIFVASFIFSFFFLEVHSFNHQEIAKKHLETHCQDELDADWEIEDFFGCIYVINLPKDKDRLIELEKSFKRIGLKNYNVLSATDGKKDVEEKLWKKFNRNWANIDLSTEEGQEKFKKQNQGEAGCYLSHYRIIKEVNELYNQALADLKQAEVAKDGQKIANAEQKVNKYKSVLIIEDDNGFGIVTPDKQFVITKNVGALFRQAMLETPLDWDMLYFMALGRGENKLISNHIVKLERGICANAIAINHTLYDPLLKELEKIFDPNVDHREPLDDTYALFHPSNACFAIFPSIAYQRPGSSNIISKANLLYRQTQAYFLPKE
jgi:hypothetical protein